MNTAGQKRLNLVQKIATGYTANPKLAVLVIAGSVGRNWADRYSDIELDLYWHEPPNDIDRLKPIEQAHGLLENFFPYEEEEWAEEFTVEGAHIGTSGFLVSTMERYLQEVVKGGSTAVLPQIRLAAIQHCIPLHGAELVQAWQAKAAHYPPSLAHHMITTHLDPSAFSGWYKRDMLVARGDWLLLYDVLCRMEKNVLGALHGLNRIYLANPSFKWLEGMTEQMPLQPPQLATRLKRVFAVKPAKAVETMENVLSETVALIEANVQGIDLTAVKAALVHKRAIWE